MYKARKVVTVHIQFDRNYSFTTQTNDPHNSQLLFKQDIHQTYFFTSGDETKHSGCHLSTVAKRTPYMIVYHVYDFTVRL